MQYKINKQIISFSEHYTKILFIHTLDEDYVSVLIWNAVLHNNNSSSKTGHLDFDDVLT